MIQKKVLIVDDDPDISEILEFNLIAEGLNVETAISAEEALSVIDDSVDLILLDVMMGGVSGYKLAEQLRKEGRNNPIIFITAKDGENEMLTGFSLGADDYIPKPFSIKEVIARVKAVLRRIDQKSNDRKSDHLIEIGLLSIDTQKKDVSISSNPIALTKTEYNILFLLVSNQDRIFSRQEIIDQVWGNTVYITERTVDVHITRLRKKLDHYSDCIVNRLGYGYKFQKDKL